MPGGITEHLYRIKENIKLVESGHVNENVLGEIESDFLGMIELIKLFLISERDTYYGYFLMNMQFQANFRSNGIAGIKLNTFPPVFEANPLLLCKFTLKQIIYVTCHEIDHVVLNHPAEMVKANPAGDQETFYRFNLAADAAVNDRINNEIETESHAFMAAPDGIITSPVLSKMFRLGRVRMMENYAYYFDLIAGKKDEVSAPNGHQRMMDALGKDGDSGQTDGLAGDGDAGKQTEGDKGENCTDDRTGQFGGDAQGSGESSASTGQEGIVTAKNCRNVQDHQWEAGDDAEDAAAAVREFVNAAVGTMSEESRGLMPASFMNQVRKLNEPPRLSWQSILKKYVGTITANKRKTRMRLNRRQPERFDLSGSVDDKVLKIVVAIDTSSSVDDRMISMIFNEIFAILAKRKHDITVIECDAEVQRVYKAKTPADIKLKVAGRGGTWFSPVIEYVNKDRYFRDALLIYFTDGYGEHEIPRPLTYRNMWVVIGDERNLSLKEPYGTVLSLRED